MPFFLLISDHAKDRLRKLKRKNPELARRYLKKFDDIIQDPFRFDVLRGDLHDARKAKVEKYRIIFDIHPKEKSVVILLIGHRKEIYTDSKLKIEFLKSKGRTYSKK